MWFSKTTTARSTAISPKGLLDHAFVDAILAGQKWDTVDLFGQLEGKLREERRTMPRVAEDTSWPSGVFRSENLVRKVQERGDALFSALGFRRRSRLGFSWLPRPYRAVLVQAR